MDTANQIYPAASGATKDYSKIPADLQEWPQWVCWRYEMVNGRKTKVPYTADGARRAKVTDPQTWASFADAVAGSAQMDGIGFVFTANDPFAGIDLDDKEDKPASDADRKAHTRIFEQFNTYTEHSPSGRGYHLILRGTISGDGMNRGSVEAYSQGRYFTFTGDVVRNAPIANCAEPLAKLVAQMRPLVADAELVQQEGDLTDPELHERASNAANGAKYSQLTRGEWKAMGYESQSEADFALLSMLAFYSCDNEQVRRVFRCTALGKREKATRNDAYLNRCLKKIRAQQQADQPSSARVEAARQSADSFWREPAAPALRATESKRVNLITAASVQSEPIHWLWSGWLARGKLHVLAGAPGTGKTTIALHLAACASAGHVWPCGIVKPTPGNVVVWSGEDDIADTLRPRLVAAGADLSRVHFVGGVQDGSESRPFDPARDVPSLAQTLARLQNVSMLVVDPLVSAVGGDSHKNAETRRSLQPLVDLAASIDAALIGITHYTKGTQGREPLERVTGSLAFGALARVVFGTVRQQQSMHEDANGSYLFARMKSNIGPDGGGFAYAFEQTEAEPGISASRIVWGAAVDGSARELLGEAETGGDREDRSASAECAEWLQRELSGGLRNAKEIQREASDAGYSPKVLRRAREKLGIKPIKLGSPGDGGKQRWVWAIPGLETEEPDA